MHPMHPLHLMRPMHDANGKGAAERSVAAPLGPGPAGAGLAAGKTPARPRLLSAAAPWGAAAAVLAAAAALLHRAVGLSGARHSR